MTPDVTPADYWRWTTEHVPAGVAVGLTLVRVAGARRTSVCYALDCLPAAERFATSRTEPGDIYYRVTLVSRRPAHPGSQGEKRDAALVTHFAADIDHSAAGGGHAAHNLPADAEACVAIADELAPPSCIVSSGGGVYALWRLTEPLDVTTDDGLRQAEHLGRRLNLGLIRCAGGLHVDGLAHNMTQIIRPPGTISLKRAEPAPVTVLRHWTEGHDWSLAALRDRLPAAPAPRRARPSEVATSAVLDLPAVLDADRLHEWHDQRPQGDWRTFNYAGRPGHTYALKVSADGRWCVVWSATLASELDLPQGCAVPTVAFARHLADANRKATAPA